MTYSEAIAGCILSPCAERGISDSQPARLAGVNLSTVSSLLSPERRATSAVTVKRLCDGLVLRLSEWFADPAFVALSQEIA